MSIAVGDQLLRRNWWLLALRGVVAILFGLAALFWPGLTLLVLVVLFGIYALIDGIAAVVVAFQERNTSSRWWVVLLEGIAGILFALITFFWPSITALVLLYVVAFWAIVTGLIEISTAFSLHRTISHEWTLVLAGVVSLLFGLFLIVRPGRGLLTLVWLVGIYAIVFGVLFIIRAFQFRASPATT